MRFSRNLLVVFCVVALFLERRAHAGFPPADLELTKGKFLVATKKQGDPRFMQTVVLLLHYSKEGAMGLILNYPTEHKLSESVPDAKRIEGKLFFGGPVERSKVFLLFRTSSSPVEATRIFDHVYFSTSKTTLEEAAGGKMRLYSGYSGWGPGQLENEISNGHWYVWHADAETIFDKPAEEIWPELIRRTSVVRASIDIWIKRG